ncbi:MAG: hypothetical protein EON51_15050 [Acinetobacter sp.]|nr:MAG: hypothetical protein EON51_15050 [Acinetobacter sp.]
MKRNLYKIHGEQVEKLPYVLKWVGDLIYYDWALLSVYAMDGSEEPFMMAWVDSSKTYERYLVFRTSKRALAGYLLQQIPYFELISNPSGGHFYAVDIDNYTGEEKYFTKLDLRGLHERYLPQREVKFRSGDDDSVVIIEYFSLETNLEKYLFGTRDIVARAKLDKSELVNMHLTSNNGLVGPGEIQSNILAETLLAYNKMAEAVVLKLYDEKHVNRSRSVKWLPGERDNIIDLARTTFYAATGSFDVILTPVKIKKEDDGKSSMENIVERIFELFSMGQDLNFSDVSRPSFPQEMLSAYEAFLGVIQRNCIHVAMQYANPEKEYRLQESFDPIKANNIIKQLRSIEDGKPIERKFIGKFVGFLKEKHEFEFMTATGAKIIGTFSAKTEEKLSPLVNFTKDFEISVTTRFVKKSNRVNPIEKNELTNCYKIKL